MVLDFDNLYKKYKMNVTGIIHVGGHYGKEAVIYKKHNIENVHFFEPLKKNYNVLVNNIYNYKSYNYGLGAENKICEIHVETVNDGQSCSLLEPKEHLRFFPAIQFLTSEYVEIKKLDDFKLSECNLLNIDVQGYELEVLKGSTETLTNIDYIICEINLVEHYKNAPMINDLDEYLKEFVRADTCVYDEFWGDAFYIRKSKLKNL
jgi:FkbM family methyltransferase